MDSVCRNKDAARNIVCAGGGSLHVCMTPHGPDAQTYEQAVDDAKSTGPQKVPETTLAFMFEMNATPRITTAALRSPCLDARYHECWADLKSHFTGPACPEEAACAAKRGSSAATAADLLRLATADRERVPVRE